MVTLQYDGRTGNNMLQYVASYIFAKKHNLLLDVTPKHYGYFGDYFNFPRWNGGYDGSMFGKIVVDDEMFYQLMIEPKIPPKNYHFKGFYQNSCWLEPMRDEILGMFRVPYEPINHDSVFVHYRIGDLDGQHGMLSIDYYVKALELLNRPSGFISSDTINHPNCRYLMDRFNLVVHDDLPLKTINFGSRFKYTVLSEGSFSFWIGFLTRGGRVVCSDRPNAWCNKMNMSYWEKLTGDW